MPYVVRYLDGFQAVKANYSRVIPGYNVRYTKQDASHEVETSLELWYSSGSQSAPYSILLMQKKAKSSTVFVLYESDKQQEAQDAFGEVLSKVGPFVENGNVMLNEHLLERILKHPGSDKAQTGKSDIPTVFQWKGKGKEVYVCTSFYDWESNKIPLHKSHGVLTAVVELPAGVHEFKYIVDGEWQYDNKETVIPNSFGTFNNVRSVTEEGHPKSLPSQKDQSLAVDLQQSQPKEGPEDKVIIQLVKEGKSLAKPVPGKDGSNPIHLAAEEDEYTGIRFAYFYMLKLPLNDPRRIDFVKALDAFNNKGFTPLMLAVKSEKVDSAMAVLLAEANPNIRQPNAGDMALHLACECANLELVRMLIVFFADLVAPNKAGKTPLDLAKLATGKDAAKCVTILKEIIDLMKTASTDVSDEFQPMPTPENSTFLLALDGGSTRALSSIQILFFLVMRMKRLKQNTSSIRSYFDYIAGTSAGAISALGFEYLDATPEFCRAATFKLADVVMSGGPTFPASVMEENLKDHFGEMKMSDKKQPRVIITSVIGDVIPPVLHLMCNYRDEYDIYTKKSIPPDQRMVWEAARASSAAPFYFTPFKLGDDYLVDGGVMANNPSLDSLTEIFDQGEKESKNISIGLVLSIGTGFAPFQKVKDFDVFLPHLKHHILNLLKDIVLLGEDAIGLYHLFHTFISQSTHTGGQDIKRTEAWCNTLSKARTYFRFSAKYEKAYGLGEAKTVPLTEMMYAGHKYALQNIKDIDTVARILLSRGPVNP